jgi:tetratricopeptide (TPR) repeat protein
VGVQEPELEKMRIRAILVIISIVAVLAFPADTNSETVISEQKSGQELEALQALAEAAQLSPDDAALHYRLSQAYSAINRPAPALEAVNRSVELEPENLTYLKARAQLAAWAGDSGLAADTYGEILAMTPEDDEVLLNYARTSSWSGRTDDAALAYSDYLGRHPDEEEVYVEHIKVESWRGDYAESMTILGNYSEKFGESGDYRRETARTLAWADRPNAAMELITPLLDENPEDYGVNYSRTIAFNKDSRPSEAIDSLAKLAELKPDAKETEDIRKVVLTPQRPDITFGASFYTDTDDLDRYRGSVVAGYSTQPETRLTLGIAVDYLEADTDTGFETLDGDKTARHTEGWIGIDHVVSSQLSVEGHVGAGDAEGDSKVIYGAALKYRPLDNLRLTAETDYGFYVVSPRSVDMGIRRSSNHLKLDWEPNLVYRVLLGVGYNDFSDDNESWEVVAAPRRAILRREKINLDMGLRGTWYGFDEALDNGYYDPDYYQSYMVTSLTYWKISDDDGIGLALDAGVVKDDEMDSFEFGWGASVEGVFGLYRDAMLRVGASAFNNQRTSGGAFEAYEAHAAVTLRF